MSQDNKQVVGGVFVGACVALLGHVGATQWFAHKLHYDERFLGAEVFYDRKIDVKFYLPHEVWAWSAEFWGGRINELIMQSAGAATTSLALALVFGAMIAFSGKKYVLRTSHGSARWATEDEIDAPTGKLKKPGELDEADVLTPPIERYRLAREEAGISRPDKLACCAVVGMLSDGRLIYSPGKEHIMGSAPTRSGKGIGWVLPTLGTWRGSTIVTDIKGENYQITGWWRSLFSHVIYFNPTDPFSAKWNPMLEIRKGERAIQDAMNLAEILGGHSAANGNEFWDGGAKKFLTATILYVLYTQQDKSLGKCAKLLMQVEQTFEDFADVTVRDPADPHNEVEQYIQGIASAAAGYSESVRGGWAAGADGALDLWKDPIVARNTARSDFRLFDIQYAERPVSLFLVIPPPDIKRLSPLVRLFFQQTIDTLTHPELEDRADDRHRLLLMMDELPAFGNMGKLEPAMGYIAGFDLKAFIIAQGTNQVRGIYGENEQIVSNCHTFVAYRPNDITNAEELSALCGTTTGYKEQEGESGKKGLLASLNNQSISMVEYERPLLYPDEASSLDKDRLVVKQAGENPILGYRLKWFENEDFKRKFGGKRWRFPTAPLTDFPVLEPSPWVDVVDPSKDDGDLTTNMLALDAQVASHDPAATHAWINDLDDPEARAALLGGEAPAPLRESKESAGVIDEMTDDIPQDMSPREAALHMTTSALKRSDVDAMLERAVRAGLVSQAHLDMLRQDALEASGALNTRTPDTGSPLRPEDFADEDTDFDPFADEPAAPVSDFDPFAGDELGGGEHDPGLAPEPEPEPAPDTSGLDSIFAQMGLPSAPQAAPEPAPAPEHVMMSAPSRAGTGVMEDDDDDAFGLMSTLAIPDMEAHLRELGAVYDHNQEEDET